MSIKIFSGPVTGHPIRARRSSNAARGWEPCPVPPEKILRITLAAVLLVIFSFQSILFAEKVRYVIDGDTFILQNNQRVRMVGINAPEISHRRYGKKKGQPHGQDAKRYLKNLIEKKEVTLKKGGNDTYDRFGRRLAYVYLPDGTFVNRKMVADGYAEAYRKFPFEYKTEFLQLEHEAQLSRKGIWTAKKQNWLEKLLSGEQV